MMIRLRFICVFPKDVDPLNGSEHKKTFKMNNSILKVFYLRLARVTVWGVYVGFAIR